MRPMFNLNMIPFLHRSCSEQIVIESFFLMIAPSLNYPFSNNPIQILWFYFQLRQSPSKNPSENRPLFIHILSSSASPKACLRSNETTPSKALYLQYPALFPKYSTFLDFSSSLLSKICFIVIRQSSFKFNSDFMIPLSTEFVVSLIPSILFFKFFSFKTLPVYKSAGGNRLHNSSKTIPNVNIVVLKAAYSVLSPFQNLSFGLQYFLSHFVSSKLKPKLFGKKLYPKNQSGLQKMLTGVIQRNSPVCCPLSSRQSQICQKNPMISSSPNFSSFFIFIFIMYSRENPQTPVASQNMHRSNIPF